MNRTQWLLFSIGLPGWIVGLLLCAPHAQTHPLWMVVPFSFLAVLLTGTLGWTLLRLFRNMRIRRVGVPVVGRVIHARSSGSVNRVPKWEIEVELPGGTTAKLMVVRYGAFTPGEPIELLVDPRDPRRAVTPKPRGTNF